MINLKMNTISFRLVQIILRSKNDSAVPRSLGSDMEKITALYNVPLHKKKKKTVTVYSQRKVMGYTYL
jgi:hypothetical protein